MVALEPAGHRSSLSLWENLFEFLNIHLLPDNLFDDFQVDVLISHLEIILLIAVKDYLHCHGLTQFCIVLHGHFNARVSFDDLLNFLGNYSLQMVDVVFVHYSIFLSPQLDDSVYFIFYKLNEILEIV